MAGDRGVGRDQSRGPHADAHLVLQVSLSVAMGVIAGLYALSFARVAAVQPEYADPSSILVARVQRPAEMGNEDAEAFYRELRARVDALPNAASSAIAALASAGDRVHPKKG